MFMVEISSKVVGDIQPRTLKIVHGDVFVKLDAVLSNGVQVRRGASATARLVQLMRWRKVISSSADDSHVQASRARKLVLAQV